jgi:hypothetical protein
MLLICIIVIANCGERAYDRQALIGTYELKYDNDRVETLVLHADGSFSQRFRHQVNTGTWAYVNTSGETHIHLHKQKIFVGTWAMPAGFVEGDLLVRSTDKKPELVLNDDLGWTYHMRSSRTT